MEKGLENLDEKNKRGEDTEPVHNGPSLPVPPPKLKQHRLKRNKRRQSG